VHTVRRMVERDACIAVAGYRVVAALSLKLVEGSVAAGIGAGAAKAGRLECVGEIGATNRFNRSQRIATNRRVSGNRAGREIDDDSTCRVIVGGGRIHRPVKSPAPVDEVVAAATYEFLGVCSVIAAEQGVVKSRASNGIDAAECIGAHSRDITC